MIPEHVLWSTNDPDVPKFSFNENVGLNGINVPVDADPMFFFQLLVTDDLIDQMVYETNSYAQTIINTS